MRKFNALGVTPIVGTIVWIVTTTIVLSAVCMAKAQSLSYASRVNYWTGEVSTDWFEPANWSCFTVPVAIDSVIITSGCIRYPILPAEAMAECGYFELQPAATLTFTNGTLSISGDALIKGHLICGRGVLHFNGDKLQQINITESTLLHHVVITNTSLDGVIFQNRLHQAGILYVAEGSICHLTTDDGQLLLLHSIARSPEH